MESLIKTEGGKKPVLHTYVSEPAYGNKTQL